MRAWGPFSIFRGCVIEGFSITLPGLVQGGAVTILVVVFLMIVRGQLIPKSSVDRIVKEADDRVAREREIANIWQTAHDARLSEVVKLSEGLRDAVDGLATVEHLIRAIRGYGEEGSNAPSVGASSHEH